MANASHDSSAEQPSAASHDIQIQEPALAPHAPTVPLRGEPTRAFTHVAKPYDVSHDTAEQTTPPTDSGISWHPRVTPYRLLVTALVISLGTVKIFASQSDGESATAVTIEWVSGVVLLLAFFFIQYYEPREDARPVWLFKSDTVNGLRALGIKIPPYDTEERPLQASQRSGRPILTRYRILVSACAISFGVAKASLAYLGFDDAPAYLDSAYDVPVFLSLYYLGMYEYSPRHVMPGLFHQEYSQQVSWYCWVAGLIGLQLAALSVLHLWIGFFLRCAKEMFELWAKPADWSTLIFRRPLVIGIVQVYFGLSICMGVSVSCAIAAFLCWLTFSLLTRQANVVSRALRQLPPSDNLPTVTGHDNLSSPDANSRWVPFLKCLIAGVPFSVVTMLHLHAQDFNMSHRLIALVWTIMWLIAMWTGWKYFRQRFQKITQVTFDDTSGGMMSYYSVFSFSWTVLPFFAVIFVGCAIYVGVLAPRPRTLRVLSVSIAHALSLRYD